MEVVGKQHTALCKSQCMRKASSQRSVRRDLEIFIYWAELPDFHYSYSAKRVCCLYLNSGIKVVKNVNNVMQSFNAKCSRGEVWLLGMCSVTQRELCNRSPFLFFEWGLEWFCWLQFLLIHTQKNQNQRDSVVTEVWYSSFNFYVFKTFKKIKTGQQLNYLVDIKKVSVV